jgi:hypothetical protein
MKLVMLLVIQRDILEMVDDSKDMEVLKAIQAGSMSYFSWNYRGLGNLETVCELQDFVKL